MKLTVDFWIPSLTERCSFVANELGFGSGICLLQWDLHNEAPSRLMQPGNIPGHWHWLLRAVECLAHCTALPLPISTLSNPSQAQFRSLALPGRWFGTIPSVREGWTVWLWTLPCQLGCAMGCCALALSWQSRETGGAANGWAERRIRAPGGTAPLRSLRQNLKALGDFWASDPQQAQCLSNIWSLLSPFCSSGSTDKQGTKVAIMCAVWESRWHALHV